jgi:hypothetical protein
LIPNLKRVSADLAGLAKTNLLLVRCVRNGLIILLAARYHQGTLMNTCTRGAKTNLKLYSTFEVTSALCSNSKQFLNTQLPRLDHVKELITKGKDPTNIMITQPQTKTTAVN